MTAVPASERVSELRDLFRYLSDFRVTFETTGLESITTPFGNVWSIWDLEYLYRATERLTLRQRQAITLCLVHGVKESDAAEMMGVSRTNPVMMYASLGLHRLLDMIDYGELERFNKPRLRRQDLLKRHVEAIHDLAVEIERRLVEIDGCLLFPNRSAREPRVMVRSAQAVTGYVALSPMQILWMDRVGPVPPECRIAHSEQVPRVSIACSNPGHGELIQPPVRKARIQALAAQYIRSRSGAA